MSWRANAPRMRCAPSGCARSARSGPPTSPTRPPWPLAGHHVILWPDADADPKKGRAHMLDMAGRLAGIATDIAWIEPSTDVFDGWDAADADEATIRRLIGTAGPVPRTGVRLTPASSIKVRPVRWLWEGRLALGTLALLGGREGIGKTTVAYTIAADVTRGRLLGAYFGRPKAVIVAATEDAWAEDRPALDGRGCGPRSRLSRRCGGCERDRVGAVATARCRRSGATGHRGRCGIDPARPVDEPPGREARYPQGRRGPVGA